MSFSVELIHIVGTYYFLRVNILFGPCLPLTWDAFLRLMVLFFFFSLHANVSPPDHTVFGWLSSFCSCSLVLCHRSWLWLSWSFAKLKMGQLPFFKWHKFVSLYLAHTSPAWEQRGGGQLWWNDLVWIKAVSQQAPQGLILSPACLVDSHSHYQPVLHYIRSFPH